MHHETALADPIVSVDTLPLEVAVVVPTLNDLQSKLAALRDAELARFPVEDRERFREFADAIAGKLLHQPLRRLKSEPDASRKLDRVEAVRHLFDLDE